MIAYVILRPDGTEMKTTCSRTVDMAWTWARVIEQGKRGCYVDLEREGYCLREVPLPKAEKP